MKQSQLIKYVDLFSFLTLVAMLATGILIEYTLPTRSGPLSIWGLTRHQWGDIHFYSSISFVVLMSAHLITHAKYIKCAILGKANREQKYRIAIGLVGVCALALLLLGLFTSPVDTKFNPRGWQHGGN